MLLTTTANVFHSEEKLKMGLLSGFSKFGPLDLLVSCKICNVCCLQHWATLTNSFLWALTVLESHRMIGYSFCPCIFQLPCQTQCTLKLNLHSFSIFMFVNEARFWSFFSFWWASHRFSSVSAFLYWNPKTLCAISHLSFHNILPIVSTQSAYYRHIRIFLHPWIHQSTDHNIVYYSSCALL